MIKYNKEILKNAIELFPKDKSMHDMIRNGNVRVIEHVYKHVKFYVDEDIIIKAFRNKKEKNLLQYAERSQSIRKLYQDIVECFDKNHERLTKNI